ncbi:pre-rRNA processing protein [Dipsacomyces acuminosporus]|nr:pre-rRNA processing protein [Dipsacomyces acuminosporus]
MDIALELQLKKLRTQANSKALHQKQHASILLAVDETIKEQNVPAEPASYFAVLLTLLEQQPAAGSKGMSNAILYLLSLVLPYVAHNTLRAKFTAMMAILSQSLDLGSADVALLRSVIACLEAVLLAQDAGSWAQPISQGTFKSLLTLATDSKPKIRKRAQDAAARLLTQPPPPAVIHPAANITSRFVLDTLAAAKTDMQAAMHTLQLVKSVNMTWPPEAFQELCETLMQLPKLNSPFLAALSFQALEAVFSSATDSLDEDQFRDILIAIIDLKPNVNDHVASEAWLKIVQKGYVAYSTINAESCFRSLPDLTDLILPDIELGQKSTRDVATKCIWALLRECIPDSMLGSSGVEQIVKTLSTGISYRYRESWPLIFLLIAALFQRLGKFAHPAMDALLLEISSMRMEPEFEFKSEADAVLGAAVRAVGPQAFLEVLPLNIDDKQRRDAVGRAWLLPLMKGHIRNAPLSYFIQELLPLADDLASKAYGFASQNRDIESKVYSALNQQVWALLGGFCNVPSDIIESFTGPFAERLASEMFSCPELRPAICGALATLLTAVHTLAHRDAEDAPLTKQQALAAQQHLTRFAPDYLSQLFNVFAQSPGASRGYLVETITAFLNVITAQEVNATFVKVCAMLDEALKTHTPPTAAKLTESYLEANPPPTAHTMLDLAIMMTPYLDAERSSMLIHASFLLIKQSDDTILQKKGYKAIYRLAEQAEGTPARQAIESTMNDKLIPMLVESAESVALSSRRERLALIGALSRNLADDQIHFIPSLLSEVILGTKEVNERARNTAFSALLSMGSRMSKGGVISMASFDGGAAEQQQQQQQQQANIEEYFKMISAGLAAQTPHMISATIASLSRVLFEFHEELETSFIVEILSTVLMFVVHNNREIAKASLGFVKVISVILQKDVLLAHLGEIVKSILKWSHEYKNDMRLKCRHILDRLARRLGLDAVAKVTPEEHMKLIANMRKKEQRAKRTKESNAGQKVDDNETEAGLVVDSTASGKKSFGNAYEDAIYGSESELEDSDNENGRDASARKGAKKTSAKSSRKSEASDVRTASASAAGAWIKEDTDGPLDFLDRSAFTHFASTNPTAAKTRRAPSAPKMKDGKLLFEDPEDEEAAAAATKKASAGTDAGAEEGAGEDFYMESIKSKDGFYRTAGNKIKFQKRRAGDDDGDVEMASDNEDGNGVQKKPNPAKRGKDNAGMAYGREFRSKKAQGDVKRGSLDPFAYIPLNPKALKKGSVSIKGGSKKDKRMRNRK